MRSKHKASKAVVPDPVQMPSSKLKKLPSLPESDIISVSDTVPDRSYTPPLPDKEHDDLFDKKDSRLKRKIRVHIDYNKSGGFDAVFVG